MRGLEKIYGDTHTDTHFNTMNRPGLRAGPIENSISLTSMYRSSDLAGSKHNFFSIINTIPKGRQFRLITQFIISSSCNPNFYLVYAKPHIDILCFNRSSQEACMIIQQTKYCPTTTIGMSEMPRGNPVFVKTISNDKVLTSTTKLHSCQEITPIIQFQYPLTPSWSYLPN